MENSNEIKMQFVIDARDALNSIAKVKEQLEQIGSNDQSTKLESAFNKMNEAFFNASQTVKSLNKTLDALGEGATKSLRSTSDSAENLTKNIDKTQSAFKDFNSEFDKNAHNMGSFIAVQDKLAKSYQSLDKIIEEHMEHVTSAGKVEAMPFDQSAMNKELVALESQYQKKKALLQKLRDDFVLDEKNLLTYDADGTHKEKYYPKVNGKRSEDRFEIRNVKHYKGDPVVDEDGEELINEKLWYNNKEADKLASSLTDIAKRKAEILKQKGEIEKAKGEFDQLLEDLAVNEFAGLKKSSSGAMAKGLLNVKDDDLSDKAAKVIEKDINSHAHLAEDVKAYAESLGENRTKAIEALRSTFFPENHADVQEALSKAKKDNKAIANEVRKFAEEKVNIMMGIDDIKQRYEGKLPKGIEKDLNKTQKSIVNPLVDRTMLGLELRNTTLDKAPALLAQYKEKVDRVVNALKGNGYFAAAKAQLESAMKDISRSMLPSETADKEIASLKAQMVAMDALVREANVKRKQYIQKRNELVKKNLADQEPSKSSKPAKTVEKEKPADDMAEALSKKIVEAHTATISLGAAFGEVGRAIPVERAEQLKGYVEKTKKDLADLILKTNKALRKSAKESVPENKANKAAIAETAKSLSAVQKGWDKVNASVPAPAIHEAALNAAILKSCLEAIAALDYSKVTNAFSGVNKATKAMVEQAKKESATPKEKAAEEKAKTLIQKRAELIRQMEEQYSKRPNSTPKTKKWAKEITQLRSLTEQIINMRLEMGKVDAVTGDFKRALALATNEKVSAPILDELSKYMARLESINEKIRAAKANTPLNAERNTSKAFAEADKADMKAEQVKQAQMNAMWNAQAKARAAEDAEVEKSTKAQIDNYNKVTDAVNRHWQESIRWRQDDARKRVEANEKELKDIQKLLAERKKLAYAIEDSLVAGKEMPKRTWLKNQRAEKANREALSKHDIEVTPFYDMPYREYAKPIQQAAQALKKQKAEEQQAAAEAKKHAQAVDDVVSKLNKMRTVLSLYKGKDGDFLNTAELRKKEQIVRKLSEDFYALTKQDWSKNFMSMFNGVNSIPTPKTTPSQTKGAQKLSAEIAAASAKAEELYRRFQLTKSVSDKINFKAALKSLNDLRAEANKMNRALENTQGFIERMKDTLSVRTKWIIGGAIAGQAMGLPNEIANQYVDLEKAMAGVQQVIPAIEAKLSDKALDAANGTSVYAEKVKQLNGELQTFIGIASQYAQDVTDVTEAAQLWGRGYGHAEDAVSSVDGEKLSEHERELIAMKNTNELVAQSATLAAVDNFKMGESVRGLEAILSAYNMRAKSAAEATLFAGRAVDIVTAVSHQGQISARELVAGIEQTGSAASQAGISLEFLSAMIETGVRNTGKTGAEIGQAIKSLAVGIHSLKGEKELKKFGIEISKIGTDGKRHLRPVQDVILDISRALQSGNKNAEKMLLAISGGRYQYSKVSAILRDGTEITRMWSKAINSNGFANRQLEVQLNTLDAKIKKMKANIIGLVQSLMAKGGGDFLKGIIDTINTCLEKMKQFSSVLLALPKAFAVIVGFRAFKKIAGFAAEATAQVGLYSTAVKSAQAIDSSYTAVSLKRAAAMSAINKIQDSGRRILGLEVQNRKTSAAAIQRQNTMLQKNGVMLKKNSTLLSRNVRLVKASDVGLKMETATQRVNINAKRMAIAANIQLAASEAAATLGISLLIAGVVSAIAAFETWSNSVEKTTYNLNELATVQDSTVDSAKKQIEVLEQECEARESSISYMDTCIDRYQSLKEKADSATEGSEQRKNATVEMNEIESDFTKTLQGETDEEGNNLAAVLKNANYSKEAYNSVRQNYIENTNKKKATLAKLKSNVRNYYRDRALQAANDIEIYKKQDSSVGTFCANQIKGISLMSQGWYYFMDVIRNVGELLSWLGEKGEGAVSWANKTFGLNISDGGFASLASLGQRVASWSIGEQHGIIRELMAKAEEREADNMSKYAQFSDITNSANYGGNIDNGEIDDDDDGKKKHGGLGGKKGKGSGKGKEKKEEFDYASNYRKWLGAISEQTDIKNLYSTGELWSLAGYITGGDNPWQSELHSPNNPFGVTQRVFDELGLKGVSLNSIDDTSYAFTEWMRKHAGDYANDPSELAKAYMKMVRPDATQSEIDSLPNFLRTEGEYVDSLYDFNKRKKFGLTGYARESSSSPIGSNDAVSYLVKAVPHMTREIALGILGNLYQEHNDGAGHLNPSGDGIGQWSDSSRKSELYSFLREHGMAYENVGNQIQFVAHELTHNESEAYQNILRANPQSPEEAAYLVSKYYERPNPNYANNSARADYAHKFSTGEFEIPSIGGAADSFNNLTSAINSAGSALSSTDFGNEGCVRGALALLRAVKEFSNDPLANSGIENGDILIQQAKALGYNVVPYSPQKAVAGSIITYSDPKEGDNAHTGIVSGTENGQVMGYDVSSSSGHRLLKRPIARNWQTPQWLILPKDISSSNYGTGEAYVGGVKGRYQGYWEILKKNQTNSIYNVDFDKTAEAVSAMDRSNKSIEQRKKELEIDKKTNGDTAQTRNEERGIIYDVYNIAKINKESMDYLYTTTNSKIDSFLNNHTNVQQLLKERFGETQWEAHGKDLFYKLTSDEQQKIAESLGDKDTAKLIKDKESLLSKKGKADIDFRTAELAVKKFNGYLNPQEQYEYDRNRYSTIAGDDKANWHDQLAAAQKVAELDQKELTRLKEQLKLQKEQDNLTKTNLKAQKEALQKQIEAVKAKNPNDSHLDFLNHQLEEVSNTYAQLEKNGSEFAQSVEKSIDKIQQQAKASTDALNTVSQKFRSAGAEITDDFFEKLIFEGKGLTDILKDLRNSIAKIALRRVIESAFGVEHKKGNSALETILDRPARRPKVKAPQTASAPATNAAQAVNADTKAVAQELRKNTAAQQVSTSATRLASTTNQTSAIHQSASANRAANVVQGAAQNVNTSGDELGNKMTQNGESLQENTQALKGVTDATNASAETAKVTGADIAKKVNSGTSNGSAHNNARGKAIVDEGAAPVHGFGAGTYIQGAGLLFGLLNQMRDEPSPWLTGLSMLLPFVPFFLRDGGSLAGFAAGGDTDGLIKGAGTGTSDSILTYLANKGRFIRTSNGEFIVKKSSVDAVGVDFLNKLNDDPNSVKGLKKYASGGALGEEMIPTMTAKAVKNYQSFSKNKAYINSNARLEALMKEQTDVIRDMSKGGNDGNGKMVVLNTQASSADVMKAIQKNPRMIQKILGHQQSHGFRS